MNRLMESKAGLLGHLVPRLTPRVEDAATIGLAFVLNASEDCRRALDGLLSHDLSGHRPIKLFASQVTHEDGSRPDMVDYDSAGRKRLLVEVKFWAPLLEGQASGYFGQLDESEPGNLLFVVPASRIETLWTEIRQQMQSGGHAVESEMKSDRLRCAGVDGSASRLTLLGWSLLFDRLQAAEPAGSQAACDLRQLRGLAEQQDSEAFVPIRPEEFSPSVARRLRSINRLVDDVVSRGASDGWIEVDGKKASSARWGYWRKFRFVHESGDRLSGETCLGTNTYRWATRGNTPVWLWPNEPDENARRLLDESYGLQAFEDRLGLVVPITLKSGMAYEEVLDDVEEQLRTIAEILLG